MTDGPFSRDQATKGPTFDDDGPNYNDLRNIRYEDQFLLFKRAGNHAAYLQKVIDYTSDTALEVACGTGTQAMAIDPYVESTYGVELDADRTKLTYKRGRRIEADTDFIRADMFELPFPDDSVSVIFNSGIFQHFQSEGVRSFLDESTRVASDYLVLSVANKWYPHHGRQTRRMESHSYWCQQLDSHPSLELVEDGEYGNRLDTAFRRARNLDILASTRWFLAGIPNPRSWFVLAID